MENECENVILFPSNLKNQLKTELRFECSECQKKFKVKSSLAKHMLIHSDVKDFSCADCGKMFKSKALLDRHVYVHVKKPYKCTICLKLFRYMRSRDYHMNTVHTDELNYHCSHCQKAFKTKTYLSTHLLVHSDVRDFCCSICEKRFKSKCSLTVHFKIHTGLKIHQCSLCSQSFRTASHRHRHMETVHSDERNYHCPHCSHSCNLKSNLAKHIRLLHGPLEQRKRFKCDECDKSFFGISALRDHKHFHRSGGQKCFVCGICNMEYDTRDALRSHVKRNHDEAGTKFKWHYCNICQGRFVSPGLLKQHMNRHSGNKPFECEVCHKTFHCLSNLTNHKVMHSGVKKFQCEICKHTFTKKNSLTKHLLNMHGDRQATMD